MKTFWCLGSGKRTARALFWLMLAICLQGGQCGGNNNQTENSTPPINGNNPNVVPPGNATTLLLNQINNYRAGQGLAALMLDPIGNEVALDEVNAWAASGYSPTFSYDVLGDLCNHGVTVSTVTDSLAQGYAQPAALFNALQQDFSPFGGPYTRIGIALINPGNGNDWAIIQY
jgi:hypothetical protein